MFNNKYLNNKKKLIQIKQDDFPKINSFIYILVNEEGNIHSFVNPSIQTCLNFYYL